jgi:hypothetical protein
LPAIEHIVPLSTLSTVLVTNLNIRHFWSILVAANQDRLNKAKSKLKIYVRASMNNAAPPRLAECEEKPHTVNSSRIL